MEKFDKNNYARVHSIETLGTVDGPGIRFVVFMQGCILKCKYWHNRDTWECNVGNKYNANQILKKILRCKPYIDETNGGVTASGGEPLLQSEFLIELFKKCKEEGIHTAIDTAGSIPINNSIKELLNYTDLVILDIKHINNKKCMDLTGYSNENELKFAKYCSKNNITMWIRQVLVPGYTDDLNDLRKTRKFINKLKNVERVEVLPYHDLGKSKWEKIGIPYPLSNVKIPTEKEIEIAKEILEINYNFKKNNTGNKL